MSHAKSQSIETTSFIVTVLIDVLETHVEEFHTAILRNAQLTRELEPGCLQFDIAIAPEDCCRFFLYEIYRHKADFDGHLASAHFRDFDKLVSAWTVHKTVQTYWLVYP